MSTRSVSPPEPAAPVGPVVVEPPPRRDGALRRSRRRLIAGLVAPAVVFMTLVHLLPALGGLYLSFKNLNLFTFSELFGAPWAGLDNYRSVLFESDNPLHDGFVGAVQNTAVYTFWTVLGTLGGGLAVALLLNRQMRGIKLIRTLMLTPWIVPSFVVAVLWQFMWQSDVGIVNKVLVDYTGIVGDRPVWLIGENSLWAIIVPSVWRGLPFAMLIFLAGLQAIPSELQRGRGDRRRRPVAALPPHHAAAAAAADRRPAAVPRDLRDLPVRDPVRDVRQQPGARRGPDDDADRPPVVLEQPVRLRQRGLGAADDGDVRLGRRSGTARSSATWSRHDAPPRDRPRPRRADMARPAGDARADHLARRLVAAGRPRAVDGRLRPARPDVRRVHGHVADDRLRALLPQQPADLHRRPRCSRRRSRARPATRSRASRSAARARSG